MKIRLVQTQPTPGKDSYSQKWVLTSDQGNARLLTKTTIGGHTIQGPNPTLYHQGNAITAHTVVQIALHAPMDDGDEIEITQERLEQAIAKGII